MSSKKETAFLIPVNYHSPQWIFCNYLTNPNISRHIFPYRRYSRDGRVRIFLLQRPNRRHVQVSFTTYSFLSLISMLNSFRRWKIAAYWWLVLPRRVDMQLHLKLLILFRWRGENVATAEVEAVISNAIGLKDAVVYGVEVMTLGNNLILITAWWSWSFNSQE